MARAGSPYLRWSDDENEVLTARYGARAAAGVIACELGRSLDSVRGQIEKLRKQGRIGKVKDQPRSIEEATVLFWSKVDRGGAEDCWPWNSATKCHFGYGGLSFRFPGFRPKAPAHRVAYTLAKGAIPDGLIIRHTCDKPSCCNPAHLIVGTYADNARDCVERGRHPTKGRKFKRVFV